MKQLSRWIPVSLIVIVTLVLMWVWETHSDDRQRKLLVTATCLLALGTLLGLWFVLLGPFRRRTRLFTCVVLVSCGAVAASLVRVRGVTGDLVPILGWRHSAVTDTGFQSFPTTHRTVEIETDSSSHSPYPQFLGPNRNATVHGAKLIRDWEKQKPRQVWRREVGPGWSAFAVDGDVAITQEQHGDTEMVTCYSLLTGELHWKHGDPVRYDNVLGGVGPRATPTISQDRVYTVGATGVLNCLDRTTGRRVWSHDVIAENSAKPYVWGMSGSPLVLDEVVVVSVGGENGRSLVAYRKADGELAWHGGNAGGGYSSPSLATLATVPQILVLHTAAVIAHDPTNGKVLWTADWPGQNAKAAQPVTLPGNRVMISSGYGNGCTVLQIERKNDGLTARQLWKNLSLKAKFANFVARGDFVYGLDDGILVCVNVQTGKRRWKSGRYGHGQLILADDLLLIMAESGEVLLVEATPDEHRELTRFTAFQEKTWNSPALATPYLLVRNDREAACFELPVLP